MERHLDKIGRIDNTTRFSYDRAGNQTEYRLDKWGRIVEIRQADGSSEYYAYDYAGNIIQSTDGEGNTTTYDYNSINQLAAMTDPEGNRETYAYDTRDRLCRKTDRNGTETTYTYNLYNNLLERKAKRTSDNTASLSERYEYTPEGLLKSAISNSISEGIPAEMQYAYTYNIILSSILFFKKFVDEFSFFRMDIFICHKYNKGEICRLLY